MVKGRLFSAGANVYAQGMKSAKELALDRVILRHLEKGTKAYELGQLLTQDEEIQSLQEYANIVAIKRLGYNDHGPVHMRQVAVNALVMLRLLHDAGIKTSMETEEEGDYDDSTCAVLLAGFLHDMGMTVSRADHELTGLVIARPIMERLLLQVIPDDLARRTRILSVATEGIFGHMATRAIHSVEAGLILVADGCDMQKGRARIPLMLGPEGTGEVGDIHKYSSNAIEGVQISKGENHPIKIEIIMSSDVGYFQVEEVLLQKIAKSPDKRYLEVYATVQGGERKRYL